MSQDLAYKVQQSINHVIKRTPKTLLAELDSKLDGHGWQSNSYPRNRITEQTLSR